jgi:hypothetical protein
MWDRISPLNSSLEQNLGKPNVSTTPSLHHIRRCKRTLLAAPTPHKEDRVKLSSALQEPFSKLLYEASFQRKLFSSSKIQTYTCVDSKQQQENMGPQWYEALVGNCFQSGSMSLFPGNFVHCGGHYMSSSHSSKYHQFPCSKCSQHSSSLSTI